ncbi:hypothetical protein DEO72_LG11g1310 [Vigna unguiculata]|uniref:Uncharacterized protein n=1 Tax=Vigna unguiculata TaxID=3917 RepID=A0A4D6NN00_VIGUN|nr:hypothetical protein DEO72_LG11g1310 [Vigna unguiculata]
MLSQCLFPQFILQLYLQEKEYFKTNLVDMEEHADLHLSTYSAKKPNFFTLPPSVMRHIAWNEERGAAGSDAGARSKQMSNVTLTDVDIRCQHPVTLFLLQFSSCGCRHPRQATKSGPPGDSNENNGLLECVRLAVKVVPPGDVCIISVFEELLSCGSGWRVLPVVSSITCIINCSRVKKYTIIGKHKHKGRVIEYEPPHSYHHMPNTSHEPTRSWHNIS